MLKKLVGIAVQSLNRWIAFCITAIIVIIEFSAFLVLVPCKMVAKENSCLQAIVG